MPTKTTSKNTPKKQLAKATTESAETKPVPLDMAAIPDTAILDKYISRKIDGMTEFEIFEYHDKNNDNVLIEGPTGPGKTTAVMAYAAKVGKPFYSIPSNISIEPSQLFGKFIPDGKGSFKWIDGPVTWIVRHGGVLLINEVNFMPERVSTVLFGLLDLRRQIVLLDHQAEVVTAHADLVVFADMNPSYEGTRPLNKAFRNRFTAQIQWDYAPEVEKALVKSERLLKVAGQIRSDRGAYTTPTSTNMLMEFERIATDLSFDYAVSNFVSHFAEEERAAVKQLIETSSVELRAAYAGEDELDKRRNEMKDGDIDPEWGVKGVDWIFEDEASDEDDEDEDEEYVSY